MVLLHYTNRAGNTTIAELKALRDYALVLLGLNTSGCLDDIAALRWNDLQIQDATVTIHWRHPHGQHNDERLTSFVSIALLRYLHALYDPKFAMIEPDTPLWVGLRRIDDQMMLSKRAIERIYREYLGQTQRYTLQSRFAAPSYIPTRGEQAPLPAEHAAPQESQSSGSDASADSLIRATAAAALNAVLQAPVQSLAVIAPDDIATLRQEIARRKASESKSATIRDLWHTRGGKRFLAASRLYTMLV